MEDFYVILGVSREADGDTIKKAYRKLAMKYHPDQNPGDKEAEENFKKAARAYEVLSNSEKRARYDRFGHAGVDGNFSSGGFHDVSDIFSAFGDIFGDFFGGAGGARSGRGRGRRASRGADLRYYLEIDLLDVIEGAEKDIQFDSEETCETCKGSRAEPGSSVETCSACGGTGQQVRSQGFFSFASPCVACGGSGEKIVKPCKACHGQGRVVQKRKLSVNIPPGVDNGTQLRLTGEGERGFLGGPSGDLYVEIRVRPHEQFERQDLHLLGEIKVSYIQALLGTEVKVKTLRGEEILKVPAGTQPGEVLRLVGQGIPSLRGGSIGDLHLEVKVVLPKKLKKKEAQLLRQIAEEKREAVADEKGSFFGWKP